MIAIIKREFLRNKTSFIIYCIISVGFAWMYIALFPSIKDQSAQIDQLLKSMPDAMMEAFGIDESGYGKFENYLASELMSLIWPILAILLGVARAGATVAGDIENRTIGIEMTLPVSRVKIFITKFLGSWISILVFCFISVFSIFPICLTYGIDIKSGNIEVLFLVCIAFSALVFAASLLVSTLVSEKGRVYFAAGGFILVSYVANILAILSDGLSWLRYFSIFHYFNAADAIVRGNISFTDMLFFLLVSLVCFFAGLWKFTNRDISI